MSVVFTADTACLREKTDRIAESMTFSSTKMKQGRVFVMTTGTGKCWGFLLMNLIKKLKYKISKRLKEKIRKWLDIPSAETRLEFQTELRRVRREIERLVEGSIVGVDLGYRDESEIIIIKFSRLNNALKVIANTQSNFHSYNDLVQRIRRMCGEVNAQHVVIDSATSNADLRARILPDKRLTDMYREQLDGDGKRS
jgi:hypothetical protein